MSCGGSSNREILSTLDPQEGNESNRGVKPNGQAERSGGSQNAICDQSVESKTSSLSDSHNASGFHAQVEGDHHRK